MPNKPCFEEALEKRLHAGRTMALLHKRLAMSHSEKVEFAETMILDALAKHGDKLAIGCSFGKDSTVVLHLAIQHKPDIPVVFCNTGVEAKETIRFKNKLTKEWDLNLIEMKPETTFWEIVKEHGYPDLRVRKREPKCCQELKMKPLAKAVEIHQLTGILTGITVAESHLRKWLFVWYGDRYQTTHLMPHSVWKYHPIMFWTVDDVWDYIHTRNIPFNKEYEKTGRVGCIPCTGFKNWKAVMAEHYPALYKKIATEMGMPPLEHFQLPHLPKR